MENMLDIPKDRKRLNIGMLCTLMGATMLLMLTAYARPAAQQRVQAPQAINR